MLTVTDPGRERCGNAPYVDTDNPPGIDDMEQARLVRLALSIAIDRNEINEVFVDGRGTPIYSEYMGPDYPGWDADRATGCWDWIGNRIDCSPLLKGDHLRERCSVAGAERRHRAWQTLY